MMYAASNSLLRQDVPRWHLHWPGRYEYEYRSGDREIMMMKLLQGAAAGAVAVWAMDRLDWFTYRHQDPEARRRTDRVRPHGMDPAHVAAHRIARHLGTRLSPAPPHQHPAGIAIHYAVGMVPGALYGLLRRRYPVLGTGRGALFGLGVFLRQDELINAATGLAADPRRYPWQAHARGLAAHLVYGLVLDASLNAMEKAFVDGTDDAAREARKTIPLLNRLIATCKDGEAGFRACADDLDDSYLGHAFTARAEECADAAAELQDLVRSLGGKPETHSSMSGVLHRRWVDMKAMIAGKDVVSVLAKCERGEKVALRVYQSTLDKPLPETVRQVVERQMRGVQHNYDRVLHLRTSAEAGISMANSINQSRYH